MDFLFLNKITVYTAITKSATRERDKETYVAHLSPKDNAIKPSKSKMPVTGTHKMRLEASYGGHCHPWMRLIFSSFGSKGII